MLLVRLIYCSRATGQLGYSDLKDILEKSDKNNPLVGITGMLCYGNSMFLQLLEGDRKAVSETYSRIDRDERHTEAEIIEMAEIEHRLFGDWSMKLVQLGSDAPTSARRLVIKYSGSHQFAPQLMSARQCLHFLTELYTTLE